MRLIRLSVVVVVTFCFCCAASAQKEDKKGFVPMFDGKTLQGWDVLTCEAEVQDGMVLLKEGNGLLQSKKQYADFVLEYDWKALQKENWDSGVYFRYTEVAEGRPWPKRYQVNLQIGREGNVGSLEDAESTGLVRDGKWNHFQLTVKGTTAALKINGKPAWKADGLEVPKGYIALQAETPRGGQFLFKKVRVKELPTATP